MRSPSQVGAAMISDRWHYGADGQQLGSGRSRTKANHSPVQGVAPHFAMLN
jgi:hypothetical protein